MASLNFGNLAKPASPDEPCGAALDDDPDSMNLLARLELALPTSFFRRDDDGRQVAFDRASIDFPAAFADLDRLLARARDLRLFVLAAKLSLLNRDLASFTACLGLIADHLAGHWEALHPRLDDGDALMRDVALQGLDDMAAVVLPLQHAPLLMTRRVGPLAFRSQLVATGETRLVEGEQHPDAGAIQLALAEVDLAELTAVRDTVAALNDRLGRIAAIWAERLPGESLSWPRLSALSRQIAAFLDAAVVKRAPGLAAVAAGNEAAGNEAGAATPATTGGSATCGSVAEVKDALAACLDYFRRTEPSSPAVLLLGQAQQLIGKSLIEVIQIMFPEHVDKAVIEIGQATRFPLQLERLAAVEASMTGYDDETSAEDGDEPAWAAPAGTAAGGPPPVPVASRAEAVARMGAVARFYRQAEPSHPTPLLMDKACAMAQHDFLSLMSDILPDVGNGPAEAGL